MIPAIRAKSISLLLAILCLGGLAVNIGLHIAADNPTQTEHRLLVGSYLTMVIAYTLITLRARRRGTFGHRHIYWLLTMLVAPLWYTTFLGSTGWFRWLLFGIAAGTLVYGAYAEWRAAKIPWIRKLGVIIAAAPFLIGGIILIPLPGPGLLVILVGFLILAAEFEWAHRHVEWARGEIKKAKDRGYERLDRIKKK